MSAAALRQTSAAAWTPAEWHADARREMHRLRLEVEATMRPRPDPAAAPAPAARPAPAPPGRLLSDEQAAAYLGCSRSLVRAYVARGVLKPVSLPPAVAGNAKARLLRIDRADLDRLIDASKENLS
ncbi:MAG: helix-turn-helix domain-containing protein [Acidobacteria bacterium]|nr:helix-turn-helix domain-containing protein [Acidobacteriota bacterium]